jgi:hypothetical protein
MATCGSCKHKACNRHRYAECAAAQCFVISKDVMCCLAANSCRLLLHLLAKFDSLLLAAALSVVCLSCRDASCCWGWPQRSSSQAAAHGTNQQLGGPRHLCTHRVTIRTHGGLVIDLLQQIAHQGLHCL